jgi:hypothetical protein
MGIAIGTNIGSELANLIWYITTFKAL